jgi:hypothetical protein
MNITQFDRFRINSESDICNNLFMDVRKISNSCSEGFMAVAYEIPSMPKDKYSKHKVEVRRKERQIALIAYKYSDTEIDEYWRDAEVLYSWEQESKQREGEEE